MRLLTLLLIFSLWGCGGRRGSTEQKQETIDVVILTYDKDLTSSEQSALDESTRRLWTIVVDGNRVRRFNDVFGGSSSKNVANFFDSRVNYALSSETDLRGRIVTDLVSSIQGEEPETLALNPSSVLWYLAKVNEPEKIKFHVNDKLLDISSSRIGIMQFGESFSKLDPILQVTTLIHEARHSDCTGGALRSDLERFKNNERLLNHKCGHTHVQCPVGHPYEGAFACDEHPWGAYIVGALYAGAVALTCVNCLEQEKTLADSISLDSLQRLLYNLDQLLDGKLGPADMSSSNTVRQDQ